MKNLTQVFLNSAPSRFKLPFGVSNNVILKAVSNEVRRDKNNLKINKNCYLTFSNIDPEDNNKVLAESTFSYFNIDKAEYAVLNFVHQVTQLGEIAAAVAPADKLKEVKAKTNALMVSDIDLFKRIAEAKDKASKVDKAFVAEILAMQHKIVDTFIESVSPYIGENCPLLSLLVVTDRKGKFYDLPREDKGFISKMGGRKISIDAKYSRWYEDRNTPETAESEDIGGEDIMDEEIMLADDAQDIEGI